MAFEWLNEDSRKFLSHSYVLPGQTVESRIMDIAKAAEKILNYPGFADKFYDYMGKGYYSLSSPVWANFGNDRGLPISCNGVLVEDDMGSIFGKLGEVGIQTKHGAGTSGYFGKLRGRGAPIKDNGHSDGPVQFLNLYETATNVVSQGSVRRGAFAAYLNIDHPDIEEFLNIREVGHSIQNMSLGVTIPDWWMEEMIEEENLVKDKKLLTKNAQKLNLWAKILRKRKETGYPYLFFSDTVNDNKPQVLKDKNIPIWASNLCVKGDTKITVMFDHGNEEVISIAEFVNRFKYDINSPIFVKTEHGFKLVTAAAQTGTAKTLIQITDKITGKNVECTPDHQIFTKNRGWVMAKEITLDDAILIDGNETSSIQLDYVMYIPEIPVYDITVPDTSSFFANDILVHNCSEIMLPSSEEWSFVCNLSSLNLLKWNEWKDTDAVETLTYFLDAVMSEYIKKTRDIPHMGPAYKFAKTWRALGVGQLGWHSFLQANNIAFESFEAISYATRISKFIDEKTLEASKEMAQRYGEPEGLVGYGVRNLTRCAIAPTTSCVVPETKFLDDIGSVMDYYQFCEKGGLDLEEIMSITVEFENGTIKKFKHDELVNTENGPKMAYLITEDDEIIV